MGDHTAEARMSGLPNAATLAHCSTCSCGDRMQVLSQYIQEMQSCLQRFRNKRCQDIWESLIEESEKSVSASGQDQGDKQTVKAPKLELNDKTWAKIRSLWPSGLSSSLVKFMSSYICQTGRFEMGRSLFLINLETAAKHAKFQLEQTLFDPEITMVDRLCSEVLKLFENNQSLKSTQNVFLSKEYLQELKTSEDQVSRNDWIAVSKDASTLVYDNTTTSTTPKDLFTSKFSLGNGLGLGVRKRPLIDGRSDAQLSQRYVPPEAHTFRREMSHENEKIPSTTPVNKKSSRPRRQRSQEDQVDRDITRKKMLWESNMNLGTAPGEFNSSMTKVNESGAGHQGSLPSGCISAKNNKPTLISYLNLQKAAQGSTSQKHDLGASKHLTGIHTAIFQPVVGQVNQGPSEEIHVAPSVQKAKKTKPRGKSSNQNQPIVNKDPKEGRLFGDKLSVALCRLGRLPTDKETKDHKDAKDNKDGRDGKEAKEKVREEGLLTGRGKRKERD